MSSVYTAAKSWVDTITVLDDGDAANAASIAPALEALADQASCLVAPKVVALGSLTYVDTTAWTVDFNVMAVGTSTLGDEFKAAIEVVNGATIGSIEVLFVPDGTHAALPANKPSITLSRHALTTGVAPANVVSVVSTATYAPVSLADYNNGQLKAITISPSHTVDAYGYTYYLSIVEESGANAKVGAYYAYRINYV